MSAPAIGTPAVATGEPPRRRPGLARYALFQLRDYAIGRGLPTFLIVGMFGTLALAPMLRSVQASTDRMPPRFLAQQVAKHGTRAAFEQSMRHELGTTFLHGFLGTALFLGAVVAMSGLVANDRRQGYYRFLFSKPLSPVRYYGQAFLVHTAGFLVVITLLGLLYGAYVEPLVSASFLGVMAATFLMYAGIGFLMTTFARWDWLWLCAAVLVAQLSWDHFGQSTATAARLLYLLPPVHRTGAVYAALVGGTALPWQTLAWIAGYGAACVAAGLVMLRVQRLAIP